MLVQTPVQHWPPPIPQSSPGCQQPLTCAHTFPVQLFEQQSESAAHEKPIVAQSVLTQTPF
jgi:hypothetical protein